MTNSRVCVDASLLVKLAVTEDDSDIARGLWAKWVAESTEIAAPRLLHYEITSTLRNKAYRGTLSTEEAETALEKLLKLRVSIVEPPGLHVAGWKLATQLNRPTAYDANYLAVAEALDCPLWTADRRLYNAVKQEFPAIQLIG